MKHVDASRQAAIRKSLERSYAEHLGNSPKGDWFMNNVIDASVAATLALEKILPGFEAYVELNPSTLDRGSSSWQVDADRDSKALVISGNVTLVHGTEYASGAIMVEDDMLLNLGWGYWKKIQSPSDLANDFVLV